MEINSKFEIRNPKQNLNCSARFPHFSCSARLQSGDDIRRPSKDGRYNGINCSVRLQSDEKTKLTDYKTFGRSHAPRLREIDYKKLIYPIHIIVGTHQRQPFFLQKRFSEVIIEEIEKFDKYIVAWCLMPDHLHLLFNPDGKEINILNIIKLIKEEPPGKSIISMACKKSGKKVSMTIS